MQIEAERELSVDANVQTLFKGARLSLGRFARRPSDVREGREAPISSLPLLVFPTTTVRMETDAEPVLADSNLVVFHDSDKIDALTSLGDGSDVCAFLTADPGLVEKVAVELGIAARFGSEGFPLRFAPSSASSYLQVRVISEALGRWGVTDPLAVEDRLIGVLEQSMLDGAQFLEYRRSKHDRLNPRHHELVEDTRRVLNDRVTDALSIRQIASLVASSPYHLARVFRLHLGVSIHQYRDRLRLRYCVDSLLREKRLTYEIAGEAGFSSASHLSYRFRRAFGITPTELRTLPTTPNWLGRLNAMSETSIGRQEGARNTGHRPERVTHRRSALR